MNTVLRRLAYLMMLLASASTEFSVAATISPTVVVGSIQVPPTGAPQMATLEVSFESENPSGIPIAGFQMVLLLAGPDDAVRFTGVSAPQSHAYLFAGNSAAPLASLSPDGRQLTMGDFLDTGFGEISNGVGLATVQLLIQPGAAGKTYEVQISTDPTASYLAVDTVTFVSFATRNGTISVVPEPTTLALAIPLLMVFARLRPIRTSAFGAGLC